MSEIQFIGGIIIFIQVIIALSVYFLNSYVKSWASEGGKLDIQLKKLPELTRLVEDVKRTLSVEQKAQQDFMDLRRTWLIDYYVSLSEYFRYCTNGPTDTNRFKEESEYRNKYMEEYYRLRSKSFMTVVKLDLIIDESDYEILLSQYENLSDHNTRISELNEKDLSFLEIWENHRNSLSKEYKTLDSKIKEVLKKYLKNPHLDTDLKDKDTNS